MTALTRRINTEIRVLMLRNGMQMADLGERIGMPRATLSRRLNGNLPWTVDELENVARAFGVPITSLFGDDTPTAPVVELLPRLDSNQEPAGKRHQAAIWGRTPMRLWHVPLAA